MKKLLFSFILLISAVNVFAISAITGPVSCCVGGSATLSDSTAGGTWSSSNPLVADVLSSGVVMGIGFGTATITYTVGASHVIMVFNVYSTPTACTTALPSLCATITDTLTRCNNPGYWSSPATTIDSTLGIGVISGTTAGTVYTLTFTYSQCGTSTTFYDTAINCPAGIAISHPGSTNNVYPNPAHDRIMLNIGTTQYNKAIIFNTVGQTLMELPLSSGIKEINTASLMPGIYYILLSGEDGTSALKFRIE